MGGASSTLLGYDVNTLSPEELNSKLLEAVRRGRKSEVENLLAQPGIDLNTRDKNGDTPLILCTRYNKISVLGLLLSVSNIDSNVRGQFGKTALMWAVRNCDVKVVGILLLPRYGIDSNLQDEYGDTALILAVRHKKMAIFGLLLNLKNIDVNVKGHLGRTALLWALDCSLDPFNGAHQRYAEFPSLPFYKQSACFPTFFTPINAILARLFLLIRPDIQVNIIDDKKMTALMFAVGLQELDIVQALIARHAKVNAVHKKQKTALMDAASRPCTKIVDALVAAKADVNARNKYGKSVLSHAVGNIQIVGILTHAGAVIKVDDKENELSYAANHGINDPLFRLLSALSYAKISELIESNYFPGVDIDEQISKCIKKVLEIQKDIYIIARNFLNKKIGKNKDRLLPIEIVRSILLELSLYPEWYHHRVKKDVDCIFTKRFNFKTTKPTEIAAHCLSNKPVKPVIFSEPHQEMEMKDLTELLAQVSLEEENSSKKPLLSLG